MIDQEHKGVWVTLTERVSMCELNLVKRVPTKHANVATKAIIMRLKSYQPDLLTITFDNRKKRQLNYNRSSAFKYYLPFRA